MIRFHRLTLCLVFFAQACQTAKETKPTLSKQFDSLFQAHPEFNGVVLVAEKGQPIYHQAIGYRDFEKKIPLDTSTLFELASVSKQFTAMIIMMLSEDGKIQYDDLLEKYIPGLPYPGITIRNLLNHTSGLPDYQKIMDEHWDKNRAAGNDDIIQYLKQYHPPKNFEPGQRYEYSNTGYVMLGSVAERASGLDFVNMCRSRIFTPLRMMSTDIRTLDEKALIKNFAVGYIYVTEKGRYVRADSFPSSNYIVWLGNRKGPGRISSTASDLLRWDRALYSEKLVKKEILQQALAPPRLTNDSISNYGFGWMLRSNPSLGKVVYHTGSNPGFNTIIVRYIDTDKTVILLCNNAYSKFKKITSAIDSLVSLK